jgi:EAL domain-containing protein (putative c-di-GMP-specific phosphodiesterase class I)
LSSRRKLRWTLHDGNQPGSEAEPGPDPSNIGPDDLDVHFQPIVNLDDGRIFAHEALTRCKRKEYANPMVLFETAVEGQFVGRLGRAVREVLFARYDQHRVFVNIHPAELAARWIVRPDDPMCYFAGDLYLEITEAAAFEFHDLCTGVLKELCGRIGAKLVIDDFGAGYSNMLRIIDLEPHIVKLDRALVRGIHTQPRRRALVRHILELCVDTGARVVAEGIETEDELKVVRDIGIHYGQGYLLARPAFPPPDVHWPF